jgi:hypothetical protein
MSKKAGEKMAEQVKGYIVEEYTTGIDRESDHTVRVFQTYDEAWLAYLGTNAREKWCKECSLDEIRHLELSSINFDYDNNHTYVLGDRVINLKGEAWDVEFEINTLRDENDLLRKQIDALKN